MASEDGGARSRRATGRARHPHGIEHRFSCAVNLGIKVCTTTGWAIVNSDVTLAPDWLERLIAAARLPGVWFAAGRILTRQAGVD